MNILMVTATYPPSTNGVAISTRRTVGALRKLGHTVWVVGPDHGLEPDCYVALPTVRARAVPFAPRDYPIVFPILTSASLGSLGAVAWDIVHVHHPFAFGGMALRLGRRYGCPTVFTYHTQYDQYIHYSLKFLPRLVRDYLYQRQVIEVARRMDSVFATTNWLAKDLRRLFGSRPPVRYCSTAGLPPSFAVARKGKKSLRAALNPPLRGPVIVTASRLSREKNVPFILSSFAWYRKAYKEGVLLVIGDGPLKKQLVSRSKALGIYPYVRFAGTVPNSILPEWLGASDCFVYASTTDTAGVNIIEAMACGLPVVAIDDKTTREIITPGVNGFLTKPRKQEFARAVQSALRQKQALSRAARVSARPYRIERRTKQLIAIYRSVIAEHTAT